MFTTYDRDNDLLSSANCAALLGGGFWHRNCARCEVNSPRTDGRKRGADDFSWDGLPGNRTLQSTRMWLMCQ